MQFLSHLRISHKISALMVGLVLGFIAIGVTYYVQIDVDNEIRNVERETFDFQNRITELNLKQLQMQAATRQYLNSGDSTALERRERLSTELRGEIQAITGEFSSGNQAVELSERLAAHEEFFQAARKNLSTYGSARAGSASWRLELTQVSEDLETALRSANDSQLMARFAALQEEIDGLATRGSVNRIAYESSWARLMQALDAVSMSDAEAERARNLLERYQDVISATNEGLAAARSLDDRLDAIELGISRAFADVLAASSAAATSVLDESADGKKLVQAIVTAIIFLVAMGTAIGVYLLYKSIVFPMAHMQSVIRRINQGRSTSRVKLLGGDELGDLGRAFNQLLDERIQQLEVQSLENERLNNSIISLIKSLGMIAKRDLTIKVPVLADITGTVSDAVNLLTTETAKTLHQVKEISDEVNGVSDQLQAQSSRVIEFAEGGKKQVVAASKALELLAQAMNEVAQRAEQTRETADEAIVNTRSARQSVENTVEGIRTIRETIAETEKRTKRLGDRSQEISGIVSLINSIAERTHILALNASMHAASAGEAGKGFAVVADEVQRLAESARQSTEDIAAMVTNMRVETADTVTIMNTLIAQVAEGSRKAEQAGRDMGVTEAATRRLVENVEYIAQQAIQQADIANRVRDRSALIRNYTEKTGQQLLEQKIQTDRLKACAHTLVERINVFTLPEALRDQSSGRTATQKALPAAGEFQAAI